MPAEQTITRWSCSECGRVKQRPWTHADVEVEFDEALFPRHCPGTVVERHYVAVDTLRDWIENAYRDCRTHSGRSYLYAAGDLSALLDDLTTGGKTDAI